MKNYYLAIDIGASSGRHIVGWLEDGKLKTEEVYRFANGTESKGGHLIWNSERLFNEVVEGLKMAHIKGYTPKYIGIDTWAVDYALLDKDDKLIGGVYAYRDSRTERSSQAVHRIISFNELYQKTGIQFQPFNSIYQFYEDNRRGRLGLATDFLMIPEYLNYMLTGVKMHEYTNATTTGLVNAQTKEYDKEIIEKLGLPTRLFGKLEQPGTSVGMLKPEIALAVGGQIEVVLCASHDTSSAVEGIPMDENSPYISSGTWSLLGLKVPNALTDGNSRKANYSNEGGVGYTRYQKNIMGMWVVNRLRDELCPNKPFPQIVEEARHSTFNDYVDVDDNLFLAPKSMREAFDKWLENEIIKPQTESDYFRCAFISLAIGYMNALDELKRNSGKDFNTLYIVGGGAKNSLLNELTEQVCKLKVKALPIEVTAIGNLKIQIGRQ